MRTELEAVSQALMNACAANDLNAWGELYTDNVVLLANNNNNVYQGRDAVVNQVYRNPNGTDTFDDGFRWCQLTLNTITRISDTRAMSNGTHRFGSLPIGNNPTHGVNTSYYRKVNGNWLV